MTFFTYSKIQNKQLGDIRSSGITDLRKTNLIHENWHQRNRFGVDSHLPAHIPLPNGISFFAVAAVTTKKSRSIKDRIVGDGLVPVHSALGDNPRNQRDLRLSPSSQKIFYEMNHLDLIYSEKVFDAVKSWYEA